MRPPRTAVQEIRSLRNLIELRVKLARFRVGATNRLRSLSRQELASERNTQPTNSTIPAIPPTGRKSRGFRTQPANLGKCSPRCSDWVD